MGLNLAISRIGSVVNNGVCQDPPFITACRCAIDLAWNHTTHLTPYFSSVVSPAVANSTNVPFSLFFGAFICGASLFCTMVIYPLDLAAEQRVKKQNAKLAGGER